VNEQCTSFCVAYLFPFKPSRSPSLRCSELRSEV
jgi:hypothetical protein